MVVDCFRIEERPILQVEVIDPVKNNSVNVSPLIDTGFSGYLLLPNSLYNKVNSLELKEPRNYLTLNGIIKTRVARAKIRIGKIEVNSYIESPVLGRDIALLGREILKELRIEFKKGKEICIEDP
ncbi:MAG: clan AA aspartic protease [Sulfolobus sp.]|jgi:clan AA aspartic protease|nr:clan AA aspartic protease [Sulfolobaceae archaeon]